MIRLLAALSAAFGTFYLYTALVLGWRGCGMGAARTTRRRQRRSPIRDWLVQAGLAEVRPAEFLAVIGSLFVAGIIVGYALFGGPIVALVTGAFAGASPVAAYRSRRRARRVAAQEAWPRLIEELRIRTGSLGRSIPQALFEVAEHAPEELSEAFDAAHREWLITTDFARTITVLKSRLADATADAACETLLVAHEVGGSDIDERLEALAEDRRRDTQDRKDARSKQAGVRFARLFVLIVPLGMALAGMSVGEGRSAYQSSLGQVVVLAAIGLLVLCWIWSGRIMRLPEEQRVFGP